MSLRDDLLRRFPALVKLPEGVFVVGGAIRDLLLGLAPADVDVACVDPLSCAKRVSNRVIRLGTEDHLSAYRVLDAGGMYDFAELLDQDISADLARRDFTVNAMAVNLTTGVFLDPHGGREDLERRMVRMVDAANFDDDPLRCLKAVRMAVSLGFEIDPQTVAAIRKRADRITDVAAERVTYELSLIFAATAFRRAVLLLQRTGLNGPLFGEIAGQFEADDVSVAGAYALLVPEPKGYAKRWRWSTELLRDVQALQRLAAAHDVVALFDAGGGAASQLPSLLRAVGREDHVTMPDFSMRSLLTGEEIASLRHIAPGPELGHIKRDLLMAQLRGQVSTRDDAVAFVMHWHVP